MPAQYDGTTIPTGDPYEALVGYEDINVGIDYSGEDFYTTSNGNLFTAAPKAESLNAAFINKAENNATNLRQQLEYVAVSRATDTVTIISNDVKSEDSPLNHMPKEVKDTITQQENRSNNKEITYGKEFRRVQEESRKGDTVSRRAASLTEADRGRLADLLRRELESQGSNSGNLSGTALTYTNKKGETSAFKIRTDVSPQLFHDFFEVVRHYTPNGELVDLHDDYSDCKCYLNEDGACGFAIEPDGNLVSVFNLGVQKGFLPAIKEYVIEEGDNLSSYILLHVPS